MGLGYGLNKKPIAKYNQSFGCGRGLLGNFMDRNFTVFL